MKYADELGIISVELVTKADNSEQDGKTFSNNMLTVSAAPFQVLRFQLSRLCIPPFDVIPNNKHSKPLRNSILAISVCQWSIDFYDHIVNKQMLQSVSNNFEFPNFINCKCTLQRTHMRHWLTFSSTASKSCFKSTKNFACPFSLDWLRIRIDSLRYFFDG